MEKQLEKARSEGERRWSKIETQVRSDTARLLGKLEKAVEPPKRTRKKPPPKVAVPRPSVPSIKTSLSRARVPR